MIAGLVLAAGQSRRFGPRNKLLTPANGYPLLMHVLMTLIRAPIRPIVVVAGPDHAKIEYVCRHALPRRHHQVRVVRNRAHAGGMGSSLCTGLSALPRHSTGALVCLGDMPGIDTRLVYRLLRAWWPTLDYVRPVHDRQPGHPVLISSHVFPALRDLDGDRGAQAVLSRVSPARRRFVCSTRECRRDIDRPRALRAWSTRPSAQPRRHTTPNRPLIT